jgi:hypothetical protein
MAFDFPASPTINEIFTDPVSGASYVWTGLTWKRSAQTVVQSTVEEAPSTDYSDGREE